MLAQLYTKIIKNTETNFKAFNIWLDTLNIALPFAIQNYYDSFSFSILCFKFEYVHRDFIISNNTQPEEKQSLKII